MSTRLLDSPDEAAALVREGRLVVFPTETVYGLGALATDADAVRRIFEAKGRPSDNPLIVHLADAADVAAVADLTPPAQRLADAFWPGPLTLVLPRALAPAPGRVVLPVATSAGLGTVGVRVPSLPLAHAFLRAVGAPVAAPSANRSGRPSPTDVSAVLADLDGRVDAVLRGPDASLGLESTVVDATGAVPVVLRPGSVTLAALRTVVPETRALGADPDALARRSPGTRHRHYAPRARVVAVDASAAVPAVAAPAAWLGLEPPETPRAFARVWTFETVEAYARGLFRAFRQADAEGLATVVCRLPPPDANGLAAALADRIARAAA